jgi:hypothetical protein
MAIATYIKFLMPLTTKMATDQIAVGVAQHMAGEGALDPITGERYSLTTFTGEEAPHVDLLDYWHGTGFLQQVSDALSDEGASADNAKLRKSTGELVVRSRRQFYWCCGFFTFFFVGTIASTPLFEEETYVFVPVLTIVGTAFSLVSALFTGSRLKAAHKLEKMLIEGSMSIQIVKRVLNKRNSLPKIPKGAHKTSYSDGVCAKLKQEHDSHVFVDQKHGVDIVGPATRNAMHKTAKVAPEPLPDAPTTTLPSPIPEDKAKLAPESEPAEL